MDALFSDLSGLDGNLTVSGGGTQQESTHLFMLRASLWQL